MRNRFGLLIACIALLLLTSGFISRTRAVGRWTTSVAVPNCSQGTIVLDLREDGFFSATKTVSGCTGIGRAGAQNVSASGKWSLANEDRDTSWLGRLKEQVLVDLQWDPEQGGNLRSTTTYRIYGSSENGKDVLRLISPIPVGRSRWDVLGLPTPLPEALAGTYSRAK